MAVPIFIVHRGNSDYLKYCLHQARYYNPKSEIILIGNKSNNKYDIVRHYNAAGYSFNANLFFRSHVRHNIDLQSTVDKMWFKRWFVLRDFMEKHRYGEQFVCIDSDVMLYCNLTKEFEKFKDYSMTIWGDRGPHCLFFNNSHVLTELCDFITDMFALPDEMKIAADQHIYHKSEKTADDFKDMTVINEYRKRHPGQVGDNSVIINGSTYEGNHAEAEGYEYNARSRMKNVYWKDGFPYGKQLADGKLVKFNVLHFTGHAKSVMHRYYSGKNLRLQKVFSEVRNTFGIPLVKKQS